MKKRYYDFLSLALTAVLYIFSVIRATIVPMHVPVGAWQLIFYAAGTVLFYSLISTKPGKAVFLTSAGLGACYAIFLVIRNGISNLSETFAPAAVLINVIIQVGTGYYDNTVSDTFLMVALVLYSLIVGLPVYLFLVRKFRFYKAFIPGLAFFMVVWGLNRDVDRLSFFIFATVAVICYIKHVYLMNLKRSRINDETVRDEIFVYFIPVAVITVLLAFLIPVSPKPIEWPWLDRKIYNLWWDMQRKLTVDRYDEFSLSETGFGNPSRLGGPVYANDIPVLRVEAPTRVYLRGAVYDVYTGTGWEKSGRDGENLSEDRVYDHTELSYGWKATATDLGIVSSEEYDEFLLNLKLPLKRDTLPAEEYVEFLKTRTRPKVLAKLFPEEKVAVQHLQVRTKTLFTPLKLFVPITGLPDGAYNLNETPEGIFMSDRRLRGGSSYYFSYLQPAYGMKELENYFNLSRPGLYSDFIEYLKKFINENGEMDGQVMQQLSGMLETYKELESYSEEVYHIYTRLPDEIPERVIKLAENITRSCTTTYAKVKSLEKYLRENYNYTLTPSYPPEDRDFVDYFLFDGKEGYCSYFASALCVMTRAAGIPSRYVEGFLLPEKPPAERFYNVTNRNAHAWVEVYLEGVGWVTFEPTPPMANAQNYYVNLREATTGSEGYVPGIFEEYEEDTNVPNIVIPDEKTEVSDTPAMTGKIVLIAVFALVLLIFLANLLFIFFRGIILRLIPSRKKVQVLYRMIISYLSQAGSTIQPGQTAKEFATAVDRRYNFKSMNMSEMTELYYGVRFGLRDVYKETVKRIFSFASEVKKETGRSMYFAKKVLIRYILFKG